MAFAVGDSVDGNFGARGNWFRGRVAAVAHNMGAGGGTPLYTIAYADGDVEERVAPVCVRVPVLPDPELDAGGTALLGHM